MSNICDPFQPTYWTSNKPRCLEGAIAFEKDAAPLTKIRQAIGQAHLKPDAKKAIPPLIKRLSDDAKPVKDTYARNKAVCEESKDAVACGYAYYYDGFTKLFGPIDAITKPKELPTRIPLAPHVAGYIIANVTTAIDGEAGPPNQEVMFDTGATATGFSASFFRDNHFNFNPLGVGAVDVSGSVESKIMQLYSVNGVSFSFGKTVFSPSVSLPTPFLGALGGSDRKHHLIAIVGLDFLLSTPFEIDYRRSEMVLHQDVEQRLTAGNWYALPIKLERGMTFGAYSMSVDIFFNGHPISVTFDTGTNFSSLGGRCEHVIKGIKPIAMVAGLNISGAIDYALFPVNLKLGNRETHVVEMAVSSGPENCEGSLGTDIINNYDLMIDPRTSMAYFSAYPNRQASRNHKLCGLTFFINDGGLLVTEVDPGKPAEAAGLKKDDIIIEIDGHVAKELSMLNVQDLMQHDKTATTLVIERDGERKKIVIDRR